MGGRSDLFPEGQLPKIRGRSEKRLQELIEGQKCEL